MWISCPRIWCNLGVILRTCGGINDLNVVLFIRDFCVTSSNTLSKLPLSDSFIILLCRYLTEIFVKHYQKTYFLFYSWFKNMTTSLERHYGLTLGWEIMDSIIYSLNCFFCGVISSSNSHYFQFNFFPLGLFFSYIFPPPLQIACCPTSKSCFFNWVFYFRFQTCWFRNTFVHIIIIISGLRLQHWTSNAVIINFLSTSSFNINLSRTSFDTYYALLFLVWMK